MDLRSMETRELVDAVFDCIHHYRWNKLAVVSFTTVVSRKVPGVTLGEAVDELGRRISVLTVTDALVNELGTSERQRKLDLFAAAALPSIIAKLPLFDRDGEFGPKATREQLTAIRFDAAVSAFDYAVAMCEVGQALKRGDTAASAHPAAQRLFIEGGKPVLESPLGVLRIIKDWLDTGDISPKWIPRDTDSTILQLVSDAVGQAEAGEREFADLLNAAREYFRLAVRDEQEEEDSAYHNEFDQAHKRLGQVLGRYPRPCQNHPDRTEEGMDGNARPLCRLCIWGTDGPLTGSGSSPDIQARADSQTASTPALFAPDQGSVEHYNVLSAMADRGGSFVKALAELWRRADHENHARLFQTFGHYYREYSEPAQQKPEVAHGG